MHTCIASTWKTWPFQFHVIKYEANTWQSVCLDKRLLCESMPKIYDPKWHTKCILIWQKPLGRILYRCMNHNVFFNPLQRPTYTHKHINTKVITVEPFYHVDLMLIIQYIFYRLHNAANENGCNAKLMMIKPKMEFSVFIYFTFYQMNDMEKGYESG